MGRWLPLALVAYCALLFFPFLGNRDLTSSHEARAAQDAQMMLEEGHWLVPRLFDRHLELQKPPLFYWLVALVGWLHGGSVGVWAVRLPAALSALACVCFVYLVGLRCKRPVAGLVAGFVLASCVHFTWLAQVGRIDMPLTAAITIALGSFHLGRVEHRRAWHALGYVALACGVLLKGPIALVLPAAVAGAGWLRERRFDWRGTTLWWGIPLTFLVAAPWFVWANIQTQNQLWEVFFWHHNLERGLGGAEALASHPWWFYGPRAFVDLLPWSVVMPVALWLFLRDREARRDEPAWLGLLWFGAIALFLSLMRFKRADYLLPAYPGLAIFLGACAERWWQRPSEPEALAKRRAIFAYASGSVLLVCALCWTGYNAWPDDSAFAYRAMAARIRGQTKGPVVFFRAESHLLAYHLGRPVTTILEWENLEIWAQRGRPVYFVMPEACAREWRERLPAGALEEVLRTADYADGARDRPLVVLRNRTKEPGTK